LPAITRKLIELENSNPQSPVAVTMLSKQVIQILQKTTPQLVTTRVLPFGWVSRSKKRHLRVKSRFKELLPFYVLVTLDLLFLIPAVVFLPRACIENAHNIGDIVLPIYTLICIYLAVNLRLAFYIFRHEIATVINKFMNYETGLIQYKSLLKVKFRKKLNKFWRDACLFVSSGKNPKEKRTEMPTGEQMLVLFMEFYNLGLYISPIFVLIYLSLPTTNIANFGFYLFGPYHWTGYAYAMYTSWLCFYTLAFMNVGVFYVCAITRSTITELNILR